MSKNILIVEDEQDIAETVEFALEREGYGVIRASTAGEARGLLGENAVHLIILDIGLPDKSGLDFLREFRARSELPVILLTARSEELDRVLGFEVGADDYVVKPFSPRELAARVRAVLKRTGGGDDKAFRVDSNRRRIEYYGDKLDLSRYEYGILHLLIQRPGWIFSREKIMEMVWEEPEESFDRTVDTHIKTLRAKLKAVRNDLDPIITHRGMGYALRDDL